jgi:hypothetical protein
MNPASKKQPPLPSPLLHKYVEEREMEQRAWPRFMGSMREFLFRRNLSPSLSSTSVWRRGREPKYAKN